MKKSVWIIVICLLFVAIFTTTYNISLVGADSGFDSSYDGGSSFGGSSSSDSSGSLDLFWIIYLCFEYPVFGIAVVISIVIMCVIKSKKDKRKEEELLNNHTGLLDINTFPEEKKLEIEAFNIYVKIQEAWMNFDEETIRKYTTDEMYNMYLMQLETLKSKNQKNIMHDIKYIHSSIKERYEENHQETIVVNMQVSCFDFIIDTKTKKVVRGNAYKLNFYDYELTFVRTKENKNVDICPRCGAPVEANNSGVCEYCKSTLISNNYTLVMSKKKMISQR